MTKQFGFTLAAPISVYHTEDGKRHHGGNYRCYEKHKPLKIAEFEIWGGSCSHPVVKDADVYVGFDEHSMKGMATYPWDHRVSFAFPITDMSAPKDPESVKKLLVFLHGQLMLGKKVHLGCIGGHGRTGLILAALVKHITGNEDAITYVREHYCNRAVESDVQIEFLRKHFGIKPVHSSKQRHVAQPVSTPVYPSSHYEREASVPHLENSILNIWRARLTKAKA